MGARTACALMRTSGGVLINMGSVVSDRAVPLQGIYAASKHAIKAYTDTLRMELEHDRVPIAVTLIKPGAIDTPYYQHAKNYMSEEPAPPPPVYSADTVARAVCECAERPVRDITVGGGGRMIATMGALAPRTDGRSSWNARCSRSRGAAGRTITGTACTRPARTARSPAGTRAT